MNNNIDNNKSDKPSASTPGSRTGDRSSEDPDVIKYRDVIRSTNTTSTEKLAAFTSIMNKTRNNNCAGESGASLSAASRTAGELSSEFNIPTQNLRHSNIYQPTQEEQISNDIQHAWRLNNETPPKEVALPMSRSPPPQQIAVTNQVGASVVDGGDIGSNEESRVPIAMPTQNPSSNSLVNLSETIINTPASRAADSNPKTPSEHVRDNQDNTGSPASFYTSRTTDSPDCGGAGNGEFEGSGGNDNEDGRVCIN